MANANAIVDQMVGLGLRHGEKAGMAIASMIFFVCVGIGGDAADDRDHARPGQEGRGDSRKPTSIDARIARRSSRSSRKSDKITKTNFAEIGRGADQGLAWCPTITSRRGSGSRPSRAPA